MNMTRLPRENVNIDISLLDANDRETYSYIDS